jgi:hypothetical protein
VQQALELQTQVQEGDKETCSDDKRDVGGYQVLRTKVRAFTRWSLPKTFRPPRGRQVLVVCRDSCPDAGAPLPPLRPVERPAECTLEGGGKGDGWKAGRCRHVQVSELLSMEECEQAVVDFLAATEVGKFPPK